MLLGTVKHNKTMLVFERKMKTQYNVVLQPPLCENVLFCSELPSAEKEVEKDSLQISDRKAEKKKINEPEEQKNVKESVEERSPIVTKLDNNKNRSLSQLFNE